LLRRSPAAAELSEGTQRYTMERVEQPPNPTALGHAWADLTLPR
jgi:hypothetical protein